MTKGGRVPVRLQRRERSPAKDRRREGRPRRGASTLAATRTRRQQRQRRSRRRRRGDSSQPSSDRRTASPPADDQLCPRDRAPVRRTDDATRTEPSPEAAEAEGEQGLQLSQVRKVVSHSSTFAESRQRLLGQRIVAFY